jgi:1-aminocyclopropane-1-carboxylate deaminase/D-cysteine desulfhydrase-like pyridoxal-dependent ACC family enzyme
VEAGTDTWRLLQWTRAQEAFAPGPQLILLERVFGEQFEVTENQAAPKEKKELASGRVQNPQDPEATYAVKGEGTRKKEHVGYKVQVAETVTQAALGPGEPTQN